MKLGPERIYLRLVTPSLSWVSRFYEYLPAIANHFLPLSPTQEAIKGYRECMMAVDTNLAASRARGMADPEVQQFVADQHMRDVLQEMQDNPASTKE